MTDAVHALTDTALSHPGVRHGFFTRLGGVSTGKYQGLNIGLGSSDAPESVQQNRALAMASFDLPASALNTLYQVHSADVVEVVRPLDIDALPKADGMVTRVKGLALGIATADCAPVLFADTEAGVVGACHAGWKGALDGIVETTVLAMEKLGSDRTRITAVLGPCIHQQSYEVGAEFLARFVSLDRATEPFFVPSENPDHFQFDLPGFVLSRMAAAGVDSIGHVAQDTYANADFFYSYRRATHRGERDATGAIDYGRLLSAITLT